MTRRPRNAPVQLIPSDLELKQLADLRRWWGLAYTSRVLATAIAEAWWREAARREQVQEQQQEAHE